MKLTSMEGKRVPQATFRTRADNQWRDVTSDQIFKGKTVIVFSLPGAYTPTCSSSHLPRYNELAPTFHENGVDDILCFSVNDAFVMDAWAKELGVENIHLVPDGNGEFTQGMGMLVDKSDLGFGKRSWRYSMLVKDGVIEKMFIEPDKPGDPFEVSDADTMLRYINPEARDPEFITVFTREGCPHCARAKALLKAQNLVFEEIHTGMGTGISSRSIRAVSGRSTVPQVFIGGRHIGGADDLEKYLGK
ncbi:glutathione peroxidase [Acidithiobacillus montserratensis]|uniref:Glutathione peroxidase n=1 Tax=Acidithiobacillus montserratensis TaxID=2729135 RepID=A0ACD5HF36_9PROT|nr:glutathione peroxidase [Acidithiobacillus montserratensis]MBN2678919.1 glutathione peroxidase [Acidithiobacillaceae bacterium]MBU2747300.1 glutathione peroxidase [Acidithiobacillus montserratensis]